ncbi:MAG: DM13 domain-containing protein [Gemmatimonadales bacterium]
MSRSSRAVLLGCTALGLGLLLTRPAAAQSSEQMAKDTGMMAHDSTGRDAMAKDGMHNDGMAKDGMSHEGMAMAPHGMIGGAEGHKAGGAFEITTANGKSQVKLGDDFTVEKGPDVYVLLSRSEKGGPNGTVNLGKLQKFGGAQAYAVPAGTDLSEFSHLVLWCKKYNVTMGTASLASSGEAMHK